MPFLLNGVDVEDLRVNGTQVDRAYLNGVEVYQRIGIGTILPDGGIVFGQEGGDWLVVAPASQHAQRSWNNGTTTFLTTPLANVSGSSPSANTPDDPNSSEYNTSMLVGFSTSTGHEHRAATYCRSIGYDLPNTKDLQLIYNNRSLINAADSTGNLPTAAFAWSSTEFRYANAWFLNFTNGIWYNNINSAYFKNRILWVIPFKRIPI